MRRERPECFVGPEAGYAPLATTSEHAVAFGRGTVGRADVVAVVDPARAVGSRDAGGFGDATVDAARRARGPTSSRRARFEVAPRALADARRRSRRPAGGPARPGTGRVVTRSDPRVGAARASGRRRAVAPCRRRQVASWRGDATPSPMAAEGRRLVVVDGRTRQTAAVDYAFSLDGGDPVPGPAQPVAARTGCTARAAPSTPAASRLERRRLARARAAAAGVLGRRRLRAARRHVHRRRAPSTPRSPRLDHLVELGVDVVELMPVAAFGGRMGLGLRRRAPVCRRTSAYGGPAALPALRRRVPRAAGSASASTSSTTTSARRATTSRSSGRTSPTPTPRPWGPAVNLDGPGSRRGAPVGHRQRAALVPRLPRRRAAARRRARAARRLARRTCSPSWPTRSPRSPRELGRPLDLIAESDLNDPVMVTPTADGRPGHDGAVGRRHPPRAARRADRRDGRATTPTSPVAPGLARGGPLSVLAKTLTDGVPPRRPRVDLPGPGLGRAGRPDGHVRARVPRLPPDPRPGRQPGPRRPHQRRRSRPASRPSAPRSTCSRRSPPMVFMGEEWRASTPFQFFTSFEDQWLADAVRERSARGVRGRTAGPRTTCPTRRIPPRASASVLDWTQITNPGHTEMLDFYRELIKTRRGEPDARSGDLRAAEVDVDEADGWLIMHRGHVHVVCNFRPRSQVVPLKGLDGRPRPRVMGPGSRRRRVGRLARRPRRRRPPNPLTHRKNSFRAGNRSTGTRLATIN